MTVLAIEEQMQRSLHHQILQLPCSRSASIEMLHTLPHQSVALTPVSTNIPHVNMTGDSRQDIEHIP